MLALYRQIYRSRHSKPSDNLGNINHAVFSVARLSNRLWLTALRQVTVDEWINTRDNFVKYLRRNLPRSRTSIFMLVCDSVVAINSGQFLSRFRIIYPNLSTYYLIILSILSRNQYPIIRAYEHRCISFVWNTNNIVYYTLIVLSIYL